MFANIKKQNQKQPFGTLFFENIKEVWGQMQI